MKPSANLLELRWEYRHARLDETMVAAEPFTQFMLWLNDALRAELPVANGMAIATADADGKPSVRMVLLKHLDEHGFVFYTNYLSRKGRELAANPHASLLFHWTELERQVRVDGVVEQCSPEDADEYFAQRPLGSRHAAIASKQSAVVENRAALEQRFAEVVAQHGEQPQRPAHWGGYRLIPNAVEFWQGRENRLHDRLRYLRANNPQNDDWLIERLAP